METIENPSTEMVRVIQYQYFDLVGRAAELEAQLHMSSGCIDRIRSFREPLIRLITLALFNRTFSDMIEKEYRAYSKKMTCTQITSDNHKRVTVETIRMWKKVSMALRESKIIMLNGE